MLPSVPLLPLVLLVLVPSALASPLLADTQTPGLLLLLSGRAGEWVHAARGWGGSSAEMGGTARAAGGRASTPLVAGSSCIPSHDDLSEFQKN